MRFDIELPYGMKLLAIETSSETASVALLLGDEVRAREGGTPGTHARFVLPWVTELLGESGLSLPQLDGIAFSAGPGSFTGLRLAVSVAQGLSVGSGVRLVAVPTLEALALSAGDGFKYVCVDARMSEVYSACYEVRGDVVSARSNIRVSPPAGLSRPEGELASWQGCGSGFALAGVGELPWVAGLGSIDSGLTAHARQIGRLGCLRLAAGEGIDAALASPIYVRDKVAQTTAERLAAGGRA
ncbi:tRNA (adenosine(37)-N6)-threonylcarbamoyltransferase complex dimerization subunit type 1 TsaB [Methyloversatilis sp.]|uniref:tRNA (adenosine(37)-N6)-threonylcarbamoyltransferase complex dimerization subunit type 1 TsaB n=1 Tax=Methyloversatilis sp. TaxID=2569862 RepID=UPI0027BB1CA3|nr:tRNA (adenosine(37)-N6)-threonylcarbamoyltransferase complex dimerization subunit type 1 TsaB [Methyloversatilis sp.]